MVITLLLLPTMCHNQPQPEPGRARCFSCVVCLVQLCIFNMEKVLKCPAYPHGNEKLDDVEEELVRSKVTFNNIENKMAVNSCTT